ncbi:hypothetical protein R3X25_11505 [Lutibacter sp. TH_r2]|uniref:hypothetical protein n=1 Tax=Lutibacter sp. TH_r2 TaxID=3082083 RepID=UPI00295341D2|nr:hypothetical protein [Lutibacter sp. TH_r2]MDV7187908.1 hypothetical protein [Lutibacter sp. TH_r2]
MTFTFNRYRHHQNILKFLTSEYDSNFKNKGKIEYTHIEIAEKFKINDVKALEVLTELRDDDSVKFSKPNKYIASNNGFRNIKSNKYDKIHKKHLYDTIIKQSKDFIIILVGVLTLASPLFKSKNSNKKLEEQLDTIQLQVKDIELELSNLKNTQKRILNDSLFLK